MEDSKRTERQRKAAGPRKETHRTQLLSAVFLTIVGAGLLVAGFLAPPQGEIHGSVLVAFGEILTFVGALFGIDYHYKFKLK